MNNNKQDYYNQEIFWEEDLNHIQRERIRIDEIIKYIPKDVNTILDVGCGNGAVLNRLVVNNNYNRLVGVDFSETALKYVRTEKYLMNVNKLKFEDRSFDLLLCNEVLEHLTHLDYQKVITELSRVAKKYILVTTPNNENLETLLVCCPECNSWFNQEYHVRSFNELKLSYLFKEYRVLAFLEIGENRKMIRHNNFSKLFAIYNLNRRPSIYAKCPQCELSIADYFTSSSEQKYSMVKRLLAKLSLTFLKQYYSKPWLLALYERK
jgi:ubiquinone/menaquinone biosynthesis C-methylase UbiE